MRSPAQTVSGHLDQGRESLGIAGGDVGQDLAVELELGAAQPPHERGIREAVPPRGSADPGDPQSPELPLPGSPVAVGVLAGVQQLLAGHAEPARARPTVTLGALEHLPSLLLRVDPALDPGHGYRLPRSRRTPERSRPTWPVRVRRRFRLEPFFPRLWFRFAPRWSTLPFRVTRKRLAAPRCVFRFTLAPSARCPTWPASPGGPASWSAPGP